MVYDAGVGQLARSQLLEKDVGHLLWWNVKW